MKKIIKSSTERVPVTTEEWVLDEVPTEGSLNSVTSGGVFAAIQEGGGGTSYTAGDGIAISSDGEISAKVDGETITVNSAGELVAEGGGSSYTFTDGVQEVEGAVSLNRPELVEMLYEGGTAGLYINSEGSLGVAVDEVTIALTNPEDSETTVLSVLNPMPEAPTSASDAGKVLTIATDGAGGYAPSWAAASGGLQSVANSGALSGEGTQASPLALNTDSSLTQSQTTSTVTLTPVPYGNSQWTNITASLTADQLATIVGGGSIEVTMHDCHFWDSNNAGVLSITQLDNEGYIEWDSVVCFGSPMSGGSTVTDRTGTLSLANINTTYSHTTTINSNKTYVVFIFKDNGSNAIDVRDHMLSDSTPAWTAAVPGGYQLSVAQPLPASLGTAGQVLTVNSGATGVEWASPSSGGGAVFIDWPTDAPTSQIAEGIFNDAYDAYTDGSPVFLRVPAFNTNFGTGDHLLPLVQINSNSGSEAAIFSCTSFAPFAGVTACIGAAAFYDNSNSVWVLTQPVTIILGS